METDYSDEGDTSGAVTITIDGDKQYVRKYTLTGNITSIIITATNLTPLFPTDLILIFEQTAGNAYTLPDVTALHPDTILSKSVIAAGETEEYEFVTYDAGTEWILKSQHDNALLAYLDGLDDAGWAAITNFTTATKAWWEDSTAGITDGLAGLLKGISDAWDATGTSGATWQARLVNMLSTYITAVAIDFGDQIVTWWGDLDDTDTGVDGFFYQVKTIGQPVFEWLGEWENDTRAAASSTVTYSDPPTFEELSTEQNAFHLRIIRGVSTWWGLLDSSSSGFDGFFYQIKTIGEPVFRWMSDWENDTRASGTPANPTFSQLITGNNAFHLRIIRGVSTWWTGLTSSSTGTFDQFFYQIKKIGEPVFEWLENWESDTRAPASTTVTYSTPPTFGELTSGENLVYKRVIRGVTSWWDALPAVADASGFDLPFAYIKQWFSATDDLGIWLFDNVVEPVQTWWTDTEIVGGTDEENSFTSRVWRGVTTSVTSFAADTLSGLGEFWEYLDTNVIEPVKVWWEATTETGTDADNTFPARAWRGITALGSDFADDVLEGLGSVWQFFNTNVITPVKTWWDATASTGTTDVFGNSNTIPVRVFRGLLYIANNAFRGEVVKLVTGGLAWAFNTVDATWNYLRDQATDFVTDVKDGVISGITWVHASVSSTLDALIASLSSGARAAWTWLKSLPSNVTGTLKWAADLINGADTGNASSSANTAVRLVAALFPVSGAVIAGAAAGLQKALLGDDALTVAAKIQADITEQWRNFWVDTGDAAASTTATLVATLQGIADFFTGDSTDGANTTLSNLGTTSINKPLIFDTSTNAGANSNTVSVSQDRDDLYLKVPTGDIIYQQVNGDTIAEARGDQFKISKKLLFGNSSVPGNSETGIGVFNNGLYLKNSGSDKIYFQTGGNSVLQVAGIQVESRQLVPQLNNSYKLGTTALKWSTGYMTNLQIYDDLAVQNTIRVGSSSTPTSTTKQNGDIWKSGNHVMIQSDGSPRSISDIGGSTDLTLAALQTVMFSAGTISSGNIDDNNDYVWIQDVTGTDTMRRVTVDDLLDHAPGYSSGDNPIFGTVRINSTLNHDGSRVGFYGHATVTRQDFDPRSNALADQFYLATVGTNTESLGRIVNAIIHTLDNLGLVRLIA